MTALQDAPALRVQLVGELDHARGSDLDEVVDAFARSDHASIDLDVSAVEFIDSLGLSMLVRLHALAAERGGRVTVVGPRRQFSRVLHVSGIDTLVDAAEA